MGTRGHPEWVARRVMTNHVVPWSLMQEQRIQQNLFDETHKYYLSKGLALLLDVTGGWHGRWGPCGMCGARTLGL
jgi:hypothetical protein